MGIQAAHPEPRAEPSTTTSSTWPTCAERMRVMRSGAHQGGRVSKARCQGWERAAAQRAFPQPWMNFRSTMSAPVAITRARAGSVRSGEQP